VNDVKGIDADRRRDGTAFPLVAQRQMERNAAPRQGSTQEILTEPDRGATNDSLACGFAPRGAGRLGRRPLQPMESHPRVALVGHNDFSLQSMIPVTHSNNPQVLSHKEHRVIRMN
jgi:hypothetical protein